MWKEEEHGSLNINSARLSQLQLPDTECIITACPFCKTRLHDAAAQSGTGLIVTDLAEHLLNKITEENL